MKKQTQETIVKNRLERYGQINNLWAINNGLWRLGAVIHQLKKQGVKIEGEFLPTADGKISRIYNYKLIK